MKILDSCRCLIPYRPSSGCLVFHTTCCVCLHHHRQSRRTETLSHKLSEILRVNRGSKSDTTRAAAQSAIEDSCNRCMSRCTYEQLRSEGQPGRPAGTGAVRIHAHCCRVWICQHLRGINTVMASATDLQTRDPSGRGITLRG